MELKNDDIDFDEFQREILIAGIFIYYYINYKIIYNNKNYDYFIVEDYLRTSQEGPISSKSPRSSINSSLKATNTNTNTNTNNTKSNNKSNINKVTSTSNKIGFGPFQNKEFGNIATKKTLINFL
jgi:hypothetical protein